MGKRVLVTGGAGFIGSHLVDALLAANHEVRVLDSLDQQVHSGGRVPPWLDPRAQFIRGSVLDPDTVRRAVEGMQVICHLAAAVGVGQSMYEIPYYVDTNVSGTGHLLDAIIDSAERVEQVIVASSMSTYGEGQYDCAECGPVRPGPRRDCRLLAGDWEPRCPRCDGSLTPAPIAEEAHQENPSVYAISKKTQEDLVLTVCRAYGIPAVGFRFFNAYGPRQSQSNPYTGVLALFLSRLRNGHQPVVYEDGLQTRDFVHVRDIARAAVIALEKPSAEGALYNLGTGQARTIKSVAVDLALNLGVEIAPVITQRRRKGDIRHCFADIGRARARLSWQPQIPFGQGIAELVACSRDVPAEDRFEQAAAELAERGLT